MKLIQTNNEKVRAFEILDNAFNQSLGMTWMLKNRLSNYSKKLIIRIIYYDSSIKKGSYITSDNNGVVLFYKLQNNKISFLNIFRKLYVFLCITGIKNGINTIRYTSKINSIRPKTGWLGMLVASDIKSIDNKAAYEIKQFMFDIADISKECIYVETTIPRIRLLYKASGYTEYCELQHPYADLKIWFFKREPNIIK